MTAPTENSTAVNGCCDKRRKRNEGSLQKKGLPTCMSTETLLDWTTLCSSMGKLH